MIPGPYGCVWGADWRAMEVEKSRKWPECPVKRRPEVCQLEAVKDAHAALSPLKA